MTVTWVVPDPGPEFDGREAAGTDRPFRIQLVKHIHPEPWPLEVRPDEGVVSLEMKLMSFELLQTPKTAASATAVFEQRPDAE